MLIHLWQNRSSFSKKYFIRRGCVCSLELALQKTISIYKKKNDHLFTLSEAAKYQRKSIHNISYLITYGRINKYDSTGRKVRKAGRKGVFVSKNELDYYTRDWKKQLLNRRKSLNISDVSLAFYDLSEKERTKHIHRLHPYLGKFIPQLVEHYLTKYFTTKDIIGDPLMGSSTTLAVANEIGMRSVGIDISEFNCMIGKAKLTAYDLDKAKDEIEEIYIETKKFSDKWNTSTRIKDSDIRKNKYLNEWFAKRSLAEIAFYKSKIQDYKNQDILKIILTRAARSSRLVHHYDIATPTKPLKEGEKYRCRKHLNKTCTTLDRAIGKIKIYSNDTKRRIEDFLYSKTKY